MKKNRRTLAGAIIAGAFALFTMPAVARNKTVTDQSKGGISAQTQDVAPQVRSGRTLLQRHDLSAPGREAVQVRVDIEVGVVYPRHTHPGEEIIYVLEGLLEYYVEGKPPVTLKAGDVLFIPAETVHTVKNVGSSKGVELATYIVQKGKPLVALAK